MRDSDFVWMGDYEISSPNITVLVCEPDSFSGLYDSQGRPLFKEKQSFGFDILV